MRALVDMFARDLRARLRDRSAIVIGLLAPLALMTVFSLLSQGPSVDRRPIGVVSASPPNAVDQVLDAAVLPQLVAERVVTVTDVPDRAAAIAAVQEEDVDAALVSASAGIEVVRRGDATIGGSIADAVAQGTAAQINAVARLLAAEQQLGAPQPASGAIAAQQAALALASQPAPVALVEASTSAGGLDTSTQIAAGMATFFLFFTVQFGLLGLLQERRQGTLARLLAAPITPAQILAAKLLVSFVLGVLSMSSLLVIAGILLGAEFGSPVGVGLLVVSGVAAATATIALVAGLAKTPDQAGIAQSMIALVLGILGGSFFSLARAGGVGAVATKFTPHYWFSEGLVRMSGGAAWSAAILPAAVLLLFAVVIGVPGLAASRRSVRP